MNVLLVVTLVSPDGAYGGPVRVAFNQAHQLREQGHSVRIAGSYRGYDVAPTQLDSIPVYLAKARKALPFIGFAGLTAPTLPWWMIRHRHTFDVVHVNAARDLVTLPAALTALLLRKRVVLQTHGMIDRSSRLLARVLDALLTRFVLRHAAVVLYLTGAERSELLHIQRRARLARLTNGVPMPASACPAPGSTDVEVLYLARLHERKRPVLFVEAAKTLLREGISATFVLVGPDEGELAGVQAALADSPGDRIRWEGALAPELTVVRMRKSSVYVLPSVNEPFPMSVLEALSVGLPVVVTESCGLAADIERTGSGVVVDESLESLTAALRVLIVDNEMRTAMGRRAAETATADFSMAAVGQRLEALYLSGATAR